MSVARGYPPRPFCSNCILWFDTTAALRQHVTTDPEHVPYICETCGRRSFLTLEELKCHQGNCSIARSYKAEGYCPDCVIWYGSGREALEKHWREDNCRNRPRVPQPPAQESSIPAGARAQAYNHSTNDGTRNADARPRSTAVPTATETEADSDGEGPSAACMTPDDSDEDEDDDDRAASESEEEEQREERRKRRGEQAFEASWEFD